MHAQITVISEQINSVILGKSGQIRLAIACLLARGHLLIEDVPGVGKTTLAHAIATCLGLKFQRTQFTSDLLPADIIGVSVYNRESSRFEFHPGPVFTNVVLADEVNRATPRAQSALLEAMEENQVTTEGETRLLPQPFFVIATQNPSHQIGTFPLPESQLDRFLMRLELGYPDAQAERALLNGTDRRALLASLKPHIGPEDLLQLQREVQQVHVSPALLDYLQALLNHTRQDSAFAHGLSPRAGLALLHGARAWAYMDGRKSVIPEDLQAVLPAVVAHRLSAANGDGGTATGTRLAEQLVQQVAIP
ncbi:MAG: MoxR family ATPase [Chloroflexi bacterium]|nr:MAG: MoxR family ATPase [Chloroflexota bacterium]